MNPRRAGAADHRERGFSLQEMMVVIGILMIVAGIAIPQMLGSKQRGNATSGVAVLKAIHSAEQIYLKKTKRFGNISELTGEKLIQAGLEKGLHGYWFKAHVGAQDDTHWTAICWPKEWGVSGDRIFLITPEGYVLTTHQELITGPSAEAFLTQHAYFKSFEVKDLAGWMYLGGGRVTADGKTEETPPPDIGGGGGGSGGDSGGSGGSGGGGRGCSLAPPR